MRPTRMKLGDVALHDCGGHRLSSQSRSVSWNSSGSWLAIASSDRMARLWTIEESAASVGGREVLVVSGHDAPVHKVRFHPKEETLLCTTAFDSTVRIWDVREATQRSVGLIDVKRGDAAVSVEWCPVREGTSSLLAVTERDGSIHIYDARKLSAGTSSLRGAGAASRSHHASSSYSAASTSHSQSLCTFVMPTNVVVDACIFSSGGDHLVAATSSRGDRTGELRIWSWKEQQQQQQQQQQKQQQPKQQAKRQYRPPQNTFICPAHTGPMYSLCFSPDGKKLATGGYDAITGLWDVESLCCTSTITRRIRFIRSVAFSHDSKLLASCSAEDGIDLADASNGEYVGTVPLNKRGPSGGADEIAFNPRSYILACARLACARDNPMIQSPAVTIAKLTVS